MRNAVRILFSAVGSGKQDSLCRHIQITPTSGESRPVPRKPPGSLAPIRRPISSAFATLTEQLNVQHSGRRASRSQSSVGGPGGGYVTLTTMTSVLKKATKETLATGVGLPQDRGDQPARTAPAWPARGDHVPVVGFS